MIRTIFGAVQVTPDQIHIPQTKLDAASGGLHNILQIVFGFAGAIALVVVVLAGLRFVLAAGDPQKTAQARNSIIYALAGLAVCILAFSVVTFVLKSI